MNITKCDICKKTINSRTKSVRAGFGFQFFEVCSNCGKPVIKFLKSKKLIKEEADKKNGTR